jgi:hypothetical protein
MKKALILALIEGLNEETRIHFHVLGKHNKRNYTEQQKDFTLSLIDTYGIRATSKILEIPRRTIQRWCRQYGKKVNRCPLWVYEWVEKRRRKRDFWERRGYS